MKKKVLITSSLVSTVVLGSVGVLTGCGEVSVVNVAVTGEYANKSFVIGNEVTLEGAVIKVTFSNGKSQQVTLSDSMWNKNDYDFTTIGEKEITVKFVVNDKEETAKVKIKIVNPGTVTAVITAIDELKDITIDASSEPKLNSIRNSYNALSDKHKPLVTNFSDFISKYKTVKKLVLDSYVNLELYPEETQGVVSGYITKAKENIDLSQTLNFIDSFYESCKTSIDGMESSLSIAKKNAIAKLELYMDYTFVISDYTNEKWEEILAIKNELISEINAAKDLDDLVVIDKNYKNEEMELVDTKNSTLAEEAMRALPEPNLYTSSHYEAWRNAFFYLENKATSAKDRARIDSDLKAKYYAIATKVYNTMLSEYKTSAIQRVNEIYSRVGLAYYSSSNKTLIQNERVRRIEQINAYTLPSDAYLDDYVEVKGEIDLVCDGIYAYLASVKTLRAEQLNSVLRVLPIELKELYRVINENSFMYGRPVALPGETPEITFYEDEFDLWIEWRDGGLHSFDLHMFYEIDFENLKVIETYEDSYNHETTNEYTLHKNTITLGEGSWNYYTVSLQHTNYYIFDDVRTIMEFIINEYALLTTDEMTYQISDFDKLKMMEETAHKIIARLD